jgi:hypothetical protein
MRVEFGASIRSELWAKPEECLAYLRETRLPAAIEHHSSMLQDIADGKPA